MNVSWASFFTIDDFLTLARYHWPSENLADTSSPGLGAKPAGAGPAVLWCNEKSFMSCSREAIAIVKGKGRQTLSDSSEACERKKETICAQYLHRKSQPIRRSDITDNDINVFGLEGGWIVFFHRLNFLFCLFVVIFPDLLGVEKG